MKQNLFKTLVPNILENENLRIPQKESYEALIKFISENNSEREIGIVLPVGCGKSGCITISPFAFKSKRTLIVAPNLNIAKQLLYDFEPSNPNMFYLKTKILKNSPFPEPVEIRGTTTNRGDLAQADIVVTNIQQLQGQNNNWLTTLPNDFFDLIQFDEGHHSVAATWQNLKEHFPNAIIINYSATPERADGQIMEGRIIYSFPVARAIIEGYIKRLKAIVLNPQTLRYVRREDNIEIEVNLEEVRRLGENDADFRKSIVTSTETLNTIVNASIRELYRIREETINNRHKIIASALNFEHCIQIVEAYRSRGLRADYVHSREDSTFNNRVYNLLENHDLDVIVQVRKLGEGFDHPYLSVAAVFSIFSNLSPFVQFIGRIMRVIIQNDPNNILNQGTVIFHSGANIYRRWEDFQHFSEADQEYFNQLLPIEGIDFSDNTELEYIPNIPSINRNNIEIRNQIGITLEEIPLIENDKDALDAINLLRNKGYTPEQVKEAMILHPIPTSKVRVRQASRASLPDFINNEAGKILKSRNINPGGRELDNPLHKKTNFVFLISKINIKINEFVGKSTGQRHEFSQMELDTINENFISIINSVISEVFDG
jgi:superfamily II DNA or RNA helicase